MGSTIACPICRKEARPRSENTAFPFCSPRCKLVDLGQWFDEAYRVPAEETPFDVEGSNGEGIPPGLPGDKPSS